jgi:hypothetical protein
VLRIVTGDLYHLLSPAAPNLYFVDMWSELHQQGVLTLLELEALVGYQNAYTAAQQGLQSGKLTEDALEDLIKLSMRLSKLLRERRNRMAHRSSFSKGSGDAGSAIE